MNTTVANSLGQVLLWVARLGGLALIYFAVRYFRPTLFYKGWNTLQAAYGVTAAPAGVQLHHTSLRVGVEHYNQTAHVGFGPRALYLQRPSLAAQLQLLCIPYAQLRLQSPPGHTGPLGAPVYGIFEAAGVEIWLDDLYAIDLIAHLQ